MPRPATLGVITKSSARPVPATLEGLRAAVEERGLIVFALVDHSGEAGKRAYLCQTPSCSSSGARRRVRLSCWPRRWPPWICR